MQLQPGDSTTGRMLRGPTRPPVHHSRFMFMFSHSPRFVPRKGMYATLGFPALAQVSSSSIPECSRLHSRPGRPWVQPQAHVGRGRTDAIMSTSVARRFKQVAQDFRVAVVSILFKPLLRRSPSQRLWLPLCHKPHGLDAVGGCFPMFTSSISVV